MRGPPIIHNVRVILEDLEGRVLILERAEGQVGGGRWCLPGGKVDYGQSVEATCEKEIWEETGLEIADPRFLFFTQSLPSEKDTAHYITFYYSARYSGNIQLNGESSDWARAGLQELESYVFAFGCDDAIRRYVSGKKG